MESIEHSAEKSAVTISSNRLRHKGRFVSSKQLKRHHTKSAIGKKNKGLKTVKDELRKPVVRDGQPEGYRIMSPKVLGEQMMCTFCKTYLSFRDVETEKSVGLASLFKIRCIKCLQLNSVTSGESTRSKSGFTVYESNVRATFGALHTGIGYSQMANLVSTLNSPFMSQATFKRHERHITPAIDKVTKESLEAAVQKERMLTLENIEQLKKFLPDHLKENFLIPSKKKSTEVSNEDVVRIFGSYDMGWSKRGNGKQYDSMNGYGALIGYFSGKVLDVATINVSCKSCEHNVPQSAHDCRKNFEGSAKAMEAEAAVRLVVHSEILKKFNIEVGIFAGDNDSSSIYAIRQSISHPIVKVDDSNHTKKGVTNLLYKINGSDDPMKELSKAGKDYLRRCFAYCLEQNKGNVSDLEKALRNIPYHAFNIHDNCGDWCKYNMDKENYDHANIPGGFQSPQLFEVVKEMFEKLAHNSARFASAASSQANESLNNTIARKAPKNICFCKSESADTRVHCAICQKNYGFAYVEEIFKMLDIESGIFLRERNEYRTKIAENKSLASKTPEFKLKRRQNKVNKSMKRKKKESREEHTYQSNMTLLETSALKISSNLDDVSPLQNIQQSELRCNSFNNSDFAIVYFDIETGGFSYKDEILQVAFKCGDLHFNAYITPTKPICQRASLVHGLTCTAGELFFKGKPVISLPKRVIVGQVLHFLQSLKKPCILVGHNAKSFDIPRLILLFQNVGLLDDLSHLIAGFTDTLFLFREKFPDRKKISGKLKLQTLVADLLQISFDNAHDAMADVCALETLVYKCFSIDKIITEKCNFITAINTLRNSLDCKKNEKSFESLSNKLSFYLIKKIAGAGISLNQLKIKFERDGELETINFLKNAANSNNSSKKRKTFIKEQQAIIIINHLKSYCVIK